MWFNYFLLIRLNGHQLFSPSKVATAGIKTGNNIIVYNVRPIIIHAPICNKDSIPDSIIAAKLADKIVAAEKTGLPTLFMEINIAFLTFSLVILSCLVISSLNLDIKNIE